MCNKLVAVTIVAELNVEQLPEYLKDDEGNLNVKHEVLLEWLVGLLEYSAMENEFALKRLVRV